MTMDITLDPPRQAQQAGAGREPRGVVPRRLGPGGGAHAQEVRPHAGADHRRHGAGRPVPARSSATCSAGAVAHTGALSYVDFLVPGFVVTGVLFQGMGAASGVADDLQGGLFDRLRRLPIRLLSIVTGRVGADTALVAWGVLRHDGGRLRRGVPHRRLVGRRRGGVRLTILYGFAFVWLFIAMGLMAGSPQAAQGLSFLVFPLSFVSSAYVPVATMPGWMQGFASNQPHDADGQHGPAADGRAGGASSCSGTRCPTISCRRCCGRRDSSWCSPRWRCGG